MHTMLTFLFSARRGHVAPENDALVQVIKMRPEILQQMLSSVLNIIMFQECRHVNTKSIHTERSIQERFHKFIIESHLQESMVNVSTSFGSHPFERRILRAVARSNHSGSGNKRFRFKEFLYHSNLSKSHSGQRKTIDDRGLLQKSDGGCREERSDEEQRQVRGKSCNLRMEVSYSKEKFGFRGVLLFILIVQMFMCENSILLSFTKSFLL